MSRGSGVGEARWPHGGLHLIVNSSATGASNDVALGGGMGVFSIQCDSSEMSVGLQGSLRGAGFVDIGATTAWSTGQAANTLVQVQSSAPITHARVNVNTNGTTGDGNVWLAAIPAVST